MTGWCLAAQDPPRHGRGQVTPLRQTGGAQAALPAPTGRVCLAPARPCQVSPHARHGRSQYSSQLRRRDFQISLPSRLGRQQAADAAGLGGPPTEPGEYHGPVSRQECGWLEGHVPAGHGEPPHLSPLWWRGR